MTKVNYFVIAEDVIKAEDGSITIVRIYNRLFTEKLPYEHPPLALAMGFIPDDGVVENDKVKFKLTMTAPSGVIAAEMEGVAKRVIPKGDDGQEHEIASFVDLGKDLRLPELGVYTFNLSCGDKKIAENKFELVKKEK